MSGSAPEYFLSIEREASRRWEQLERDPGLAGPWKQLFRQVKNLHFVLSELLQNADDVEATFVKASVSDNLFEFRHDGRDFDEDNLRSLCNFGFSNKRNLHTIGFRGIGFKSVFSLGPRVEVQTPKLCFAFEEKRFTQPIWLSSETKVDETVIKVLVDGEDKIATLDDEFRQWLKSPVPLLFFKNIKKLQLQEQVVEKHVLGSGPVANSLRIRLSNSENDLLLIHSEPEVIPAEALEEIRSERSAEGIEFPPCEVQIVLGVEEGERLYTVLPTDVKPPVPFSCNAPFIQDPIRKEIKHPADSFTNKWLLERIGCLAATSMISWLGNTTLSSEERASAYVLLPVIRTSYTGLDQICAKHLVNAFREVIFEGRNVVLGYDGSLVSKGEAVFVPEPILQTWGPKKSLSIFAANHKKVLSEHVTGLSLTRLKEWQFVTILDIQDVAQSLFCSGSQRPPCPDPMERLLGLWAYLHPLTTPGYEYWDLKKRLGELCIVPSEGKKQLRRSGQVVVLGGKSAGISEDDWMFLVNRVDVVSPDWEKIIGSSSDASDRSRQVKIEKAGDLFRKLGLHQKVGIGRVIELASTKVFASKDPGNEGIRLAHIAAFSNTRVGNSFKYVMENGTWQTAGDGILARANENLELLPQHVLESKTISSKYYENLTPKQLKVWNEWARNQDNSGLQAFILPVKKSEDSWYCGKGTVERFCIDRGGHKPSYYPYERDSFRFIDWDWSADLWKHWEECSKEDPQVWQRLSHACMRTWSQKWEDRKEAAVKQHGNKYIRVVDHGALRAAWLHKLRNVRCLPDTHGNPCFPETLLRSTSETQPLINVEPFVHPTYDKPAHAVLLDLLGVRSEPKGVKSLVERLRALSRAPSSLHMRAFDLYRAIDTVLLRMDSKEVKALKTTLAGEALILTSSGSWEMFGSVFKDNPNDVPGVSVLHPEIVGLALWDRMDMPSRPTIEMALEWLKTRPFGQALDRTDKERVTQILRRAGFQAWRDCGGWLDTNGEWTRINDLRWASPQHSSVARLFTPVKKSTADFSMVDDFPSMCARCDLVPVSAVVAQKLTKVISHASPTEKPPWLRTLTNVLLRLKIARTADSDETTDTAKNGDRSLARRLRDAKWQEVVEVKMAPHIDGTQVGAETSCKALWHENIIYVVGPSPIHYREMVEQLSGSFSSPVLKKIVAECADRDPEWIIAYAEEHLQLEEDIPIVPAPTELPGSVSSGTDDTMKPILEVRVETELAPMQRNTTGNETVKPEKADDTDEDRPPQPVERQSENERDIFRRFMCGQGYEWLEARGIFMGPEISFVRARKAVFQWVEESGSGEPICNYHIARGSVEEGVEIPAEIWNMAEKYGTNAYLVLIGKDRTVRKYSIAQLRNWEKTEMLDVYPARMILRLRVFKDNMEGVHP